MRSSNEFFDFFASLDRGGWGIALTLFGFFVVLPVVGFGGQYKRRRRMWQLARELGCTYTKQQSLPGTIWRRWRRNIIEGNWRGQKILIYDAYEHNAGSHYTDGYTMINGKKYEGRWFDYLSVDRIRRVLAGDTAIQPVDDNAKLSWFGWVVAILYLGAVIAFFGFGIGYIIYHLVKSIISL